MSTGFALVRDRKSLIIFGVIMKSLFTSNMMSISSKSKLSSKLILALFVGAVPFITNCSKASYGETTRQAPLPGLVAPRVATAAPARTVAPAPKARVRSDGTIQVIDGGDSTSGETTEGIHHVKISTPVDTSADAPRIHITIHDANPCGQCSAPTVVTVIPQVLVPQTVACEGGSCLKSHFVQNYIPAVQNMDILFVIDSSTSLTDERFALFTQIESFLKFLPVGMNYQIAVLNTQDLNTSLYAAPSNPSQVISADLTSISNADRDALLENIKRDLWDRIATLNTSPLVGSSQNILRLLDRAITSPELEKNQANGFFRAGAGLTILSLTNEQVDNQVLHNQCEDVAGNVYQKLENLKHLSVSVNIEQSSPLEFIGFAYRSSDQIMNSKRGIPYSSDILQLLHLGDGVLFDLVDAMKSPEQMKADLRFAGDRVADTWMKRRFQIRADQPIDPASVCFIANGKVLKTNFVAELNEVRIDPEMLPYLKANAKNGLSTDILWCQNGKTRNNSPANIFAKNESCEQKAREFGALPVH